MNPQNLNQNIPSEMMPKMTRFDSFNYQTPGLKTRPSNNAQFDFPEIQLQDQPSFLMSIDGEKYSIFQDLNLQKNESTFNFNGQQDIPVLGQAFNKFSFEDLERKASQSCREFSRMQQEKASGEGKKLTKYAALAQYHTVDADLSLPSLSKGIKKTKLVKKTKKRVRRRKTNKYRQMKEVLLEKTCSKIFSTFAMEFEDLFSLYPSLRDTNQTKTFSTFPKVFSASNSFCQSKLPFQFASKPAKKNLHSQNSDSTGLSDDEPQFTNVKSTLVRSKVDNLKGSMLCFEMNQNLKEMLQVSKCMKWQRRRDYRTEMANKGMDEFVEDDNMCIEA
jgi:hypothetical protein